MAGENDLAALSLSYGPPDLNVGQVTLMAVSGGSRIKVWTTSTKGTEVSLPASWNLASESVPSTLYVEGVAPSGSVRDVGLKLFYQNQGEAYHEDRVNLTLVETDLDIEEVDDKNEANPGGFVGVNNDDDNDNGVEDRDPTEMTVTGEDNLVSIVLACRPSALDGAGIKLEAPSGASKIKLWTDSTKGTEVPLLESPVFSPDELPKTLYVEGVAASGIARDAELRVSCLIDGVLKHQDKVKITVVDVSLAVEDNLSDCMEGRWVTFTATAHDHFPHGLLNPICFTFHYQRADGTKWQDTDWSTDLLEDNTAVADDVLDGDPDHYFTTPIYVEAENDTAQTKSNTLEVDVYELWIDYFRDHATGKDWQVVVGQPIAYSATASSGAKNFNWDLPDGVPDAWNPTGGSAKAGTNLVIPNSDLPDNNNAFGGSYGTVKVFCEDAEGGNNTFYSTSMNPAESAKVFFDRNSTGKTGTDPNWYYYWATDNGGPCQHRYSGTTSYEGATVTWDYNGGIPGTGQTTRHSGTEYEIEVGPTTPNARNWNFNSPRIPANGTFVDSQGIARFFPANNIVLNFVRANWEGIDSVEQTLKHEKQHVLHWRRWEPPEGYWYLIYGPRVTGNVPGNNDRDDDFLPNIFEDLSGTRFDQARTFPGFYLGGDDDEVFCELQAGNALLSGNNDWAHPGKQWP